MNKIFTAGRWKLVSAAAVLALVAGFSVSRASWLGLGEPGRPEGSNLIAQSASSTSAGITLRLTGAQFTGIDTFVRLELSAADASVDLGRVRSVSIGREDVVSGPPPVGAGVSGPPEGPAIPVVMPFAALSVGAPFVLNVKAVVLTMSDGAAKRIEGSWQLQGTPPANLGQLLRTETLLPKVASAKGNGISISLLSAVRTSADTRVTVAFDGTNPAAVLTPPTMLVDGNSVLGTALHSSEDGQTATWVFPKTDFGTAVSISFSSFLATGSSSGLGGSVIDLHGVLEDSGKMPQVGVTAAIGPARVLSTTGSAPYQVTWTSGSSQANVVLELVLPSAGDPDVLEPPSLLLPSGEKAMALGRIIGFDRDASGTVVGGRTTLRYGLEKATDVDGTIVLDPAPGVRIANGVWGFDLHP